MDDETVQLRHAPDRAEMLGQLHASKKVSYVAQFQDGRVIAHTRDEALALSLKERGASVRWFDRTHWSTRSGKSKADLQAEVVLGPVFFGEA